MRIKIDAETRDDSARVSQWLKFSLARVSPYVTEARIATRRATDPLGSNLYRCQAELLTYTGERVIAEEVQTSLELAVTRALQRTGRVVQRRLRKRRHLRSA